MILTLVNKIYFSQCRYIWDSCSQELWEWIQDSQAVRKSSFGPELLTNLDQLT